jgi:DNA repair photolyase
MAKVTPLFPILETGPNAGPLARAAAQSPLESIGCLTEYRPLPSRSVLNKVASKRGLPFTHAINPYRGCEFACRYCYARYAHEFLELSPAEFERKIYFKEHGPWLLKQELKKLKPGTEIALGTATDPYQPLERKLGITRSLLEVFARHGGFKLGIVTKSALVTRDIDVLKEVARVNRLTVNITVTTMDRNLARILEPRAPRPDLRIQAIGELRRAAIRAGVLCSPLMPGITDMRSSIEAVAKAAAEAGAQFLFAGALFLKPCSLPTFFEFVQQNFPQMLSAYEKRYSANAFVSPEYRKRIRDLVESIRAKYKLGSRYLENSEYHDAFAEKMPVADAQPWLPFTQKQGTRDQGNEVTSEQGYSARCA